MPKSKRKSISARVRFEIFKRDGFVCQYCGSHPPKCILHVDHIVPVVEGGGNEDTNLITACSLCNGGKGPVSLTSIPQSLADKAAEIAEREAQLKGYTEVALAAHQRLERDAATVLLILVGSEHRLKRDWLQSVKRFVTDLGVVECMESMRYAISRARGGSYEIFRYFCGVCWGKIRNLKSQEVEDLGVF